MREQWAQSTQGSCTHISGMGSRAWEMPEASTWIIVTCLQMSVAMFGHSFVIVNIGKCPRAKQGEEKVHQSFWRLWQEKAVRCMNLSRRERVYHTEVVTSSVCIHPLPQVRPSAHNEGQIARRMADCKCWSGPGWKHPAFNALTADVNLLLEFLFLIKGVCINEKEFKKEKYIILSMRGEKDTEGKGEQQRWMRSLLSIHSWLVASI